MDAMPPFESRAGDAGRLVGRGLLPRVRFHLVLLLLAFALVLSVVVAAGASAAVVSSGGLKYVTKSFSLVPGKPRTHEAPCPKRNHVLGGGHYNSGGFGEAIGLHSYPYDGDDRNKQPDDGWAAMQRAFGEAQPAQVYAICARVTPDYAKKTETVPPDAAEDRVLVKCPLNTLDVTSGGSRGPASVRGLSGLFLGVNQWQQGVANHGTTAREVTVFAICSTLDVDAGQAQVVAEDGKQTFAQAQCPAEAPHVVGGALSTNYTGTIMGNTAVAATLPHQFTTAFDGWRVWLDNYNAIDMNLHVAAICVPPR